MANSVLGNFFVSMKGRKNFKKKVYRLCIMILLVNAVDSTQIESWENGLASVKTGSFTKDW